MVEQDKQNQYIHRRTSDKEKIREKIRENGKLNRPATSCKEKNCRITLLSLARLGAAPPLALRILTGISPDTVQPHYAWTQLRVAA